MSKPCDRSRFGRLLAGAAPLALSFAALSAPAHAIVPNDNVGPEDAVDSDDQFRGVGMFFRSDGLVCSGTLINPRTVLFAAHCVNNRPEEDYDTTIRSAWSFNVNALPGFIEWFNNGFNSNPDLAVYNVNRIFWNPQSTQNADSRGFLEGDIALASLDTPVTNVPIWSLLFSPLPTPETYDGDDGTGYHVNITGYGRSGTGTTGASQGIDWRRRAAENMLGALTSFDERNTFLFGAPFGTLPQSLYRLDFDDPNGANPFDFNLYLDEPREREGTTAGGDSGGPLILDAANNDLADFDLVIGVLSGGSRFFGPQAFSSYGTESFYQPLYLFWDYIVANNPYRYVTAKEGDGNWGDASHWETMLDPAFMIIDENGNVVNGLPTTLGAGIEGDKPDFGVICFDPVGENPGDACSDINANRPFPPRRQGPDGNLTSGIGVVDGVDLAALGLDASDLADAAISTQISRNALLDGGLPLAVEAQNGAELTDELPQGLSGGEPEFSGTPLPAPTLANGLPGATNFVPDNIDPIVSEGVAPRYFDVTLSNSGTTSVSRSFTIDKLTVAGPAGLYIAQPGSLTSLIDISQFGGSVNVDGSLTSVGDYTLFGGFLGGNGTLDAPFLTNIMGAISPGGTGTIGTFTVDGNVVLSSGSTLLIDIGPDGASDNLYVTGEANVGGVVAVGGGIFNVVNGLGQQYEIVTADGGVTGTFTEGTISAILSQSFTYEENRVLMEIEAGLYADVVDPNDPVQVSFAQLFDQNRGNAALNELFALDFADAGQIQSTLRRLAPTTETAVRTLTAQTYSQLMNFNDHRIQASNLDTAGGTIATLGNPLGTAEAALARSGRPQAGVAMGLMQDDADATVEEGVLPDYMAIYLAGGLINGDALSMPGYQTTKTDFDGFYVAGGVELFPSENSMVGVSVYHSDLEADVALGAQADSRIAAASVYGRVETAAGLVLDAQASLSEYDVDTERTISFANNVETLFSESDSSGFSAGVGVGYDLETGAGTFTPGIDARYARVSFDRVEEFNGVAGLAIDRETYKSLQGRAGIDYKLNEDILELTGRAHYVHEFEDGPQLFQANFVNGTGPTAGFALAGTDQDWFEVGLAAHVGSGPLQLGVGFDTTIGRDDSDAQTYTASATLRF